MSDPMLTSENDIEEAMGHVRAETSKPISSQGDFGVVTISY